MRDFEEQYLDILQNIEFGIVRVYREHDDLVDFEVEQALSGLIREYKADQRNRAFDPLDLAPLVRDVPFELPEPLSLDEMVACLKRIRKSVRKWNKRGGRQGYLRFIDQFVK